MTTLYFTDALHSATTGLPLDLAPPSLYLTLPASSTPQPAYLLTPATYARIWWRLVQLEDRWARGDYPPAKYEEALVLFAPLTEYALAHFPPEEIEQAQAEIMRRGTPSTPLPHPGECPATPWTESTYIYDGTSGRFRAGP